MWSKQDSDNLEGIRNALEEIAKNLPARFKILNIPNIQVPHQNNMHRILHLHKNVPGILAKINGILADHDLNISGQYLKKDHFLVKNYQLLK